MRPLTDDERDRLRQMYLWRKAELHPDETVEVEIADTLSADGTVRVRVIRTADVKVPVEWIPYERA